VAVILSKENYDTTWEKCGVRIGTKLKALSNYDGWSGPCFKKGKVYAIVLYDGVSALSTDIRDSFVTPLILDSVSFAVVKKEDKPAWL
jgi:hypothetical protein